MILKVGEQMLMLEIMFQMKKIQMIFILQLQKKPSNEWEYSIKLMQWKRTIISILWLTTNQNIYINKLQLDC